LAENRQKALGVERKPGEVGFQPRIDVETLTDLGSFLEYLASSGIY